MKRRTFLLSAAATLAAPAIRAQAAWPTGQPIRVIVPYPAGAANDAMGRLAAQRLQDKFGATVVVENRAGGSASIGTTAVLNAAPDGYTLLASAFNHIIMNHAVKGVTFDPQADFETIGRTAPALTDVVGGHVQLLIDASFALLPAAKEGRVKALGITTKDRSPLAPEFPTLAEQGLAGYDFQSWYGLWAPKGTPREICQRINALMRETMQEPAVVQRLNASLLEPVIETSDETKAYIAAEVPKHVALLKKAGFEAQ